MTDGKFDYRIWIWPIILLVLSFYTYQYKIPSINYLLFYVVSLLFPPIWSYYVYSEAKNFRQMKSNVYRYNIILCIIFVSIEFILTLKSVIFSLFIINYLILLLWFILVPIVGFGWMYLISKSSNPNSIISKYIVIIQIFIILILLVTPIKLNQDSILLIIYYLNIAFYFKELSLYFLIIILEIMLLLSDYGRTNIGGKLFGILSLSEFSLYLFSIINIGKLIPYEGYGHFAFWTDFILVMCLLFPKIFWTIYIFKDEKNDKI